MLVVTKAGGWLGGGTKTIVLQTAPAGSANPIVVAKPVAGNGFSPANSASRGWGLDALDLAGMRVRE